MNSLRKNRKKGFTLVEIIVVLVIIAILMAALAPVMIGWIREARDSSLISEGRIGLTSIQALVADAQSRSTASPPVVNAGTAVVGNVAADNATSLNNLVADGRNRMVNLLTGRAATDTDALAYAGRYTFTWLNTGHVQTIVFANAATSPTRWAVYTRNTPADVGSWHVTSVAP
jgi:type IV pilus assembly protein PilA